METTPEEQSRLLALLATHFTEQWLTATPENGIQEVWQRDDLISTQELLSFAVAIEKMLANDEKWTKEQIINAKSCNKNTARGAWFEIVGLSYLVNSDYTVAPTKSNTPGIDAVLKWSNDTTINLSLKRYDVSTHEMYFHTKMEQIEDVLKSSLHENGIIGVKCSVIFNNYPKDTDYDAVKERVKRAITQIAATPDKGVIMQHPNGSMEISVVPLLAYDLSDRHNSYELIGLCKLHDNEFKNLTDKLDNACANLRKHASDKCKKQLNGVFVHMHESVAMDLCCGHLTAYLADISDNPIGFVWLYKPSLTRGEKGHCTKWSHVFMNVADKTIMNHWKCSGGKFPKFSVVYASAIETTDIKQTLLADDVEIILNDMYIFQRGNVYVNATREEDGSANCNLLHPAPGIHIHGVFKDTLNMKDGERLTVFGRYADYEKLTIL